MSRRARRKPTCWISLREPALAAGLAAVTASSEPEPVDRAAVLPAVEVARQESPDDAVLCADTARSLVRWRGTQIASRRPGWS